MNEFLKKQEFSTFPQEFSTGCGEVLEGLSIALQGYIKINKKQKKSQKMWKSMWKLLETGKKSIVENFFRIYPTYCDRIRQFGHNEQISKKRRAAAVRCGREGVLVWQNLKTISI